MRACGTLRHIVFTTVVKNIQLQNGGKNSLWTGGKIRFIIGFTKEVGINGRPLNMCVTVLVLLIASSMDIVSDKIKNYLIAVGLAAGIILWIPQMSAASLREILTGIVLPVFICWIPFLMHALGAGDIKLLSVVGCLNGGDVVYCIVLSFLSAAFFSFCRLVARKQLWTSLISCYRYFQQILSDGYITPYPGRYEPGHRIHFSLAVFVGYMIFLGVKYCEMMSLC